MLARRGIEVTYETIRQWGLKFGQTLANDLCRRRPRPGDKWHLDEVVLKIKGEICYPDKLRSYGAAKKELLPRVEHRQHKRLNNRAENSHQPTRLREKVMSYTYNYSIFTRTKSTALLSRLSLRFW